MLRELTSQVSEPPPPIESAGRVGARLGKRSELTIIVPLVPGGAKRLAHVPAIAGWQPFARCDQGRNPPRHALRVLRQRHEDALRHFLRRRLGHLYRRLHRVDSQTIWTSSTLRGKAGQGFATPGRKITSSSTRSRQKAGSSPIRSSAWLRSNGRTASARRWTSFWTRSATRSCAHKDRNKTRRGERSNHGNANPNSDRHRKANAVVEQKIQKLKELYADAPELGKAGAGRTGSPNSSKSWQQFHDGREAKRRSGGSPSGQGLGAHRDPSDRGRWRETTSRLAGAHWKATSRAPTWSARSTTCASCFWTTTRSCSSPPPTMASGTPISTTS